MAKLKEKKRKASKLDLHFNGFVLKAENEETESLVVPAVFLVEGGTLDEREVEFPLSYLQTALKNTINWLESGEDSPIFLSNHEYKSQNVVGSIQLEGLRIEPLTEEYIIEGQEDLLGKNAIVGNIQLFDERGIQRYNSGLKKISVGLGNLQGSTKEEDEFIYEASIVPWGAVKGAQMLNNQNVNNGGDSVGNGKTLGVTIDDTKREMEAPGEIWKLMNLFETTIMDIEKQFSDEEITLEQRVSLIEGAINDLGGKLGEMLLPGGEEDMSNESTTLSNTDLTPSKEEDPKLLAVIRENEKLSQRLKISEVVQSTTLRFSQAYSLALQLRTDGILTPAKMKEMFPGEDDEQNVKHFSSIELGEGEGPPLSTIIHTLKTLKDLGVKVAPIKPKEGKVVTLSSNSGNDEEDMSELDSYFKFRGIKTAAE